MPCALMERGRCNIRSCFVVVVVLCAIFLFFFSGFEAFFFKYEDGDLA